MTSDDYRHFVCVVAGEKPQKLMAPYDNNKECEKRVLYKYENAEAIRLKYIKIVESALKNDSLSEFEREDMEDKLEWLKKSNAHEVFIELTSDYEKDPETGDAITTNNADGRWSSYEIGRRFSVPFLTMDNVEVFQARKKDINWDLIHLHGTHVYERVWEMVMDNAEPNDDYEQKLYDNMKNREFYFSKFGNKETYVASNTAFWGYAFNSEKTGWVELEDTDNQFKWMSEYYDRFIKNLPEDTLLTIYECTR